jgi:hypothetical protein
MHESKTRPRIARSAAEIPNHFTHESVSFSIKSQSLYWLKWPPSEKRDVSLHSPYKTAHERSHDAVNSSHILAFCAFKIQFNIVLLSEPNSAG